MTARQGVACHLQVLTALSYCLIFSPRMKADSVAWEKKGGVFAWLRCVSPPAWKSSCGHFHAKSGAKKSNRELGADNCFFHDERDSFVASTPHDGESAYMLGLIETSVPIRWLNHSECASRKNHNCIQTWETDRESVFCTATVPAEQGRKNEMKVVTQRF